MLQYVYRIRAIGLFIIALLPACSAKEQRAADWQPAAPAGLWKTAPGDSVGFRYGIDSLGMIFMYPPTSGIMGPCRHIAAATFGCCDKFNDK